jgi:CBS domain-containing protein
MTAWRSRPAAEWPGPDGHRAAAHPPAKVVADIMTPAPITVDVSTSIAEAARLMVAGCVGGLPVMQRGLLVGIITQGDLVARLGPRPRLSWWRVLIDHERLARECQKARGTTVGEVMSRPAIFVAPHDSLEAAARLLREHRIGRLPVMDQGSLVGIVTHSALLRALVRLPSSPGQKRLPACPPETCGNLCPAPDV